MQCTICGDDAVGVVILDDHSEYRCEEHFVHPSEYAAERPDTRESLKCTTQ